MCNPLSLILKHDGTVFLPPKDAWNHSHSQIATAHGIPDGEWGDRYARVEVSPNGYKREQDWRLFRDPATNAVLPVDDTWVVRLDEQRKPQWWQEDEAALADKARREAARWLESFPANLVPGSHSTGGDGSTNTGGEHSTNTGGDRSTNTGGEHSILCWKLWDGSRYRLHIAYVGENGIKPNTPYRWENGGPVEVVVAKQ